MKTLDLILRKNDPVDVFNAFRGQNLTVKELNFIRGGGDPDEPPQDPPQDPIGIPYPKP